MIESLALELIALASYDVDKQPLWLCKLATISI